MVPVPRRVFDILHHRAGHAGELDRLVSAAGLAHLAARRALALAIAEEEREARRRDLMTDRAADLEQRAIAAIGAGREDLARRAAETIAELESEVAASEASAERFAARVTAARREVSAQRRRLAALDRDLRLLRLGEVLDRPAASFDGVPALARAEEALAVLAASRAADTAVRAELGSDCGSGTADLADDLAEAGFGRPTRTLAVDVLARMRIRAAHSVAPHV